MKIKPVLSKTTIKGVLKDHCHHLIKYNIDDEHWLDWIAQILIEHQNDILLFEVKP
jgi:hypothetical protein